MVLLVSGGHCLLALVKSVDEFLCLGESNDNAPGEILDKVRKRLKITSPLGSIINKQYSTSYRLQDD